MSIPKEHSDGHVLSPNPTFSGHQTFAVRSGWLKKGVDALQDPTSGGKTFFTQPNALMVLGVGKNMVQSIRHWLLATRMAVDMPGARGRELQVTPLGQAIFGGPSDVGWDPFLEDPATLWLLHWQLAAPGSIAFSWIWAFNLLREHEFSKESLVDAVVAGAQARVTKVPSRETIDRDVECLLHCYVEPSRSSGPDDELDCPLRWLRLIRPSFGRQFRLHVGPKPSLPPAVFYYALASYWNRRHGAPSSLSLRDITYELGSPGMVFKLDEDAILGYLDGIEAATGGLYRFEDTPLVREVIRPDGPLPDPAELLADHYARKERRAA